MANAIPIDVSSFSIGINPVVHQRHIAQYDALIFLQMFGIADTILLHFFLYATEMRNSYASKWICLPAHGRRLGTLGLCKNIYIFSLYNNQQILCLEI